MKHKMLNKEKSEIVDPKDRILICTTGKSITQFVSVGSYNVSLGSSFAKHEASP